MSYSTIGIIGIVAISLILVACGVTRQQAGNIAQAVTQATAIQQEWDRAEEIYDANKDKLQADRREKVDRAMSTLSGVVERLDETEPGEVINNLDKAKELYRDAKSAYMTLRPIAREMIEQGDIKGEKAALLERLDERAADLDDKIQEIGDNADSESLEMLRTIRKVVPVVGKIILLLR